MVIKWVVIILSIICVGFLLGIVALCYRKIMEIVRRNIDESS